MKVARQASITFLLLALLALLFVLWDRRETAGRAHRQRAETPLERERRPGPRRREPIEPVRVQGIVSSAKEPIAEAQLTLHWVRALEGAASHPVEGEPLARGESEAGGIFALEVERALVPCEARLEARAEGFAAYLSPPFRLEASRRHDVVLAVEDTIEGIVLLESGRPVEGTLRIEAHREGAPAGVGHTNREGRFRVGGLSPGRYRLTCGSEEWMELEALEVPAGAREVVLHVAPATRIEGRVEDLESGDPVHAFDVRFDFGGIVRGTAEGTNGRYSVRVRVPPAPNRRGRRLQGTVRVEAPGYVPQSQAATLLQPAATQSCRFSLFPDRGRNLELHVTPFEGELEVSFRPDGRSDVAVPLQPEREPDDRWTAAAPEMPGTLSVLPLGVLGAEPVERHLERPGRLEIEIPEPGVIRVRSPAAVPGVDDWSLQMDRDGRFYGEEFNQDLPAMPGRWSVRLLGVHFGSAPPAMSETHNYIVWFTLEPGQRVVVDLEEQTLIARPEKG